MHRLSILYGMQFHDTDFLCSSAPLTRLHPSGRLSLAIDSYLVRESIDSRIRFDFSADALYFTSIFLRLVCFVSFCSARPPSRFNSCEDRTYRFLRISNSLNCEAVKHVPAWNWSSLYGTIATFLRRNRNTRELVFVGFTVCRVITPCWMCRKTEFK